MSSIHSTPAMPVLIAAISAIVIQFACAPRASAARIGEGIERVAADDVMGTDCRGAARGGRPEPTKRLPPGRSLAAADGAAVPGRGAGSRRRPGPQAGREAHDPLDALGALGLVRDQRDADAVAARVGAVRVAR